jgi:hypothetical protein
LLSPEFLGVRNIRGQFPIYNLNDGAGSALGESFLRYS